MEKNKYFIQWSEYACVDEHHYLEEQPPVVRNLTDNELEEFCSGGSFPTIGKNSLGKGPTFLLNEQGFMCCLGQFSPQLAKRGDKEQLTKDMLNVVTPSRIKTKGVIPKLTWQKSSGDLSLTRLSVKAIDINDSVYSTVEEKISQLRKLLKENELKLRVINKPKIEKQK